MRCCCGFRPLASSASIEAAAAPEAPAEEEVQASQLSTVAESSPGQVEESQPAAQAASAPDVRSPATAVCSQRFCRHELLQPAEVLAAKFADLTSSRLHTVLLRICTAQDKLCSCALADVTSGHEQLSA